MGLDRLRAADPAVFVSLPRNDVELARAARDGGADGVKMHLNVDHHASGTSFGSVDDERDAVRAVAELDLPVGVVPGQDLQTVRDALPALEDLPVDFVDAHAGDLPLEAVESSAFETWVGPPRAADLDVARRLERLGADAVEVGALPKDDYGTPFSAAHAATYLELVELIDSPVILPTQATLRPEDAAWLAERGVTNFLLGAIVMDDTPADVAATTRAFVDALR